MRYLSVLLLLVVLSACAPPVATPPISVPPDLDQALLDRLKQSEGSFQSLEGIAKVKVSTEGKTLTATQILLAQRPDKFRSEVLSPFGNPILFIATNGDELTVYVPGESKFYVGEATPKNLQRLLRIPLRLEDLIDVLLYDIPLFDFQHSEAILEDQQTYLLTLRGREKRTQKIRFDSQMKLLGATYLADDAVLLQIEYDRFPSDGSSSPRSVRLEMPQYQSRVSVAFSDVKNNTVIPADRFVLQPPSGLTVSPIPVPEER